ncbi:MAG TPA: hypothetical protein DCY06_10730 [Bacteroidetes bacterium]|nr:hypothetical protein [Bacteroidota bacterium]
MKKNYTEDEYLIRNIIIAKKLKEIFCLVSRIDTYIFLKMSYFVLKLKETYLYLLMRLILNHQMRNVN